MSMFLWMLCVARLPLRDRRMIRSFRDQDTKSIFERQRVRRFQSVNRTALRRLVQIDSAEELRDLGSLPASRLRPIPRNRSGQHCVRIDDDHHVCFRWKEGDAFDVEIINRLQENA